MSANFLNDNRFSGGLRTGEQYIEGIKNDGRRVFIDGEEVADVTSHPAFRGAVRSIADLYDIACDPANRDLMTFASPTTGEAVNRIWQMPRSEADLHARRAAIARWSEATFGLMGRSPDHVAGFFVGWAMAPEVLARNGADERAENLLRFFEFLRDRDVFITYTIVPPQIDRSKPMHQQDPADLYAGVVDERDDGVVIRGDSKIGKRNCLPVHIL